MDSRLVYDVGMNNGDDSAYYLHKGFRVVAIEADPTLVEDATIRFAQEIRDGRLTILNVAIAEQTGTLPFWICEGKRVFNSFDRSMASRNGFPHHQINVECDRFANILDNFDRPFFLKVDIEGYDHMCLDALAERPDKLPKYLSFEYGTESVARLPKLKALGYDQFKLISQKFFAPIQPSPISNRQQLETYNRREAFLHSGTLATKLILKAGGRRWLEGQLNQIRQIDGWLFLMDAAGPYSEEAPGEWQSYEQLAPLLDSIREVTPEKPLYGLWDKKTVAWVDIHARLKDG